MTLCIAAISRTDKAIIAVSDQLLSESWTSQDTNTVKFNPIARDGRWATMYAGFPTHDLGFVQRVREEIAADAALADVVAICKRGFRAELALEVEAIVLSPFQIDLETFRKEGRDTFGSRKFASLVDEARAIELESTFLVAGFDKEWPHIFTVSDPGGKTHQHGPMGFHAIGTGRLLAHGALAATYNPTLPANEVAYRVLEAKFVAERTPTVGKNTFAVKMLADGSMHQIVPDVIGALRKVWENDRRPPPRDGLNLVGDSWSAIQFK